MAALASLADLETLTLAGFWHVDLAGSWPSQLRTLSLDHISHVSCDPTGRPGLARLCRLHLCFVCSDSSPQDRVQLLSWDLGGSPPLQVLLAACVSLDSWLVSTSVYCDTPNNDACSGRARQLPAELSQLNEQLGSTIMRRSAAGVLEARRSLDGLLPATLVVFSGAAEVIKAAACGLQPLTLSQRCQRTMQGTLCSRSLVEAGRINNSAPLAKCISAAEQLDSSLSPVDDAENLRLEEAASGYDGAFGAVSAAEGCVTWHFQTFKTRGPDGPASEQCLVHALDDFLQRGCAFKGCCAEGSCTGYGL